MPHEQQQQQLENLASAVSSFPRISPGDVIGGYRITHRLGQGGMGDVFSAVRADGLFRRKVALKLMRARCDDVDFVAARLEFERRILAALNHPNIAKILDGGVTSHGAPYVVMEQVDGEPIHRYARQRALGVKEKLDLFLQLCEAVEYSHRNLIVHRDIKPDNILVTEQGQAILLDFGIAKLLRPELLGLGGGQNETRAGSHLMTPEFASPEQFRSERVNTASDIYSLGALLYNLLTGALPHPSDDLTVIELAKRVCEDEPTPPSQIDGSIPSDVESIVLKALRKEPEARYRSVQEFAEDVKRYLDGYPVEARAGSWRYHASKFLVRHRIAAAFTATLAVVLIASTIALAMMAKSWRDERDSAAAATDFLAELLDSANPNSPRDNQKSVEARHLLSEAALQLQGDKLKNQPRTRAALAERIGDIYRQMGAYAEAEPLCALAVQLHEQVYGRESPEAGRNLVRLADLLRERQRYPEAEAAARRSLAIRKKALGPRHFDVSDSLNVLGIVLQIRGAADESEAVFREAVEIRRAMSKTNGQRSLLALSIGNLGNVLRDKGSLDEARKNFEEALAIRREIWGPMHPRVASSLGQISQIALRQGHFDEAVKLTAEALDIARKAYPGDNPDLARVLTHYGNALLEVKRYGEAEGAQKEALTIQRNARGLRAPEVSFVEADLAAIYRATGRTAEAEALLRDVLSIRMEKLGAAHNVTAGAQVRLAELLVEKGANAEAAALLQAASNARPGANQAKAKAMLAKLSESAKQTRP